MATQTTAKPLIDQILEARDRNVQAQIEVKESKRELGRLLHEARNDPDTSVSEAARRMGVNRAYPYSLADKYAAGVLDYES